MQSLTFCRKMPVQVVTHFSHILGEEQWSHSSFDSKPRVKLGAGRGA